ncbi:MAG: zinc ribbon domain-containing protein [Kouleothrix sp.]|nr:zinc ribbon domain-containing protein [Kouleothrix sp.]
MNPIIISASASKDDFEVMDALTVERPKAAVWKMEDPPDRIERIIQEERVRSPETVNQIVDLLSRSAAESRRAELLSKQTSTRKEIRHMSVSPPNTQHCPACGKEQPRTYRFCEQCGAQLLLPTTASDSTSDAVDSRQTMLDQIRAEIEDLKSMAAAFGVERIRDGSWFNEFIHAMLASNHAVYILIADQVYLPPMIRS